jgi:hypothetical protein
MWGSRRSEAGQFAREHFEQVYRPWRKRARIALTIGMIPIAGWTAIVVLLFPRHRELTIGAGVGAALGMSMCLLDSPPEWIDKWRRGWHGERRTEKALRPLQRAGWDIAHGLLLGRRGDRDHVVAGPAGVYLLETKNLSGRLTVENGILTAQHGDDPIDSWSYTRLALAVKAAAADIRHELGVFGVRWVTPVVVLWGNFPAGIIESNGVVYLAGGRVRAWLEAQPVAARPYEQPSVAQFLQAAPRATRIERS